MTDPKPFDKHDATPRNYDTAAHGTRRAGLPKHVQRQI